MIKQIFLFLSILFVLNPVVSQCTLYKLDLYEKIVNSQFVAEGRVVHQTAFAYGKGQNDRIYTANVIELYKVFKGNASSRVVLVTQGGSLGDIYFNVEPSLKLQKGQVGMFFGKTSSINVGTDESFHDLDHYEPYGSLQGFVQYDEWLGTGADVFHKYDNIEADLYRAIVGEVGKQPYEVRPYSPFKKNVLSRMAPQIDSVNRDTIPAGSHTLFQIHGSNFEAYDFGTNSHVFFSEANSGGANFVQCPVGEIENWTDTLIELYMPSEAASGSFRVQNASGLVTDATIDLFIPYSLINVESNLTPDQFRRNILLQDANGAGGYDLALSTNTADGGVAFAGSNAQGVFDLAVSNWCGNDGLVGTGFNVMVGPTTTVNTVANDAVNAIMFDNDVETVPAGVLAQTFTYFFSCDGGNVWYMVGFDMLFRRDGTDGVTWNFGTNGTGICCYDFLSVAIHELGHAHLLDHSIGAGNVMNFAIANGTDVRGINPATDSLGGGYILEESQFLNTCDGAVVGMLPCSPLPVEFLNFEGEPQDKYNRLSWTASETIDQSGFQIDRSIDGKNFQKIGFLSINKPSNQAQSFQFDDKQLNEDTYFYRLASVSLNGSVNYSEIIEISNPIDERVFIVYPNPANDKINVFIGNKNGSKSETAIIHLVDTQGRTIYQGKEETGNRHIVSSNNLSAGVYVIRVNIPSENKPRFTRIVKN